MVYAAFEISCIAKGCIGTWAWLYVEYGSLSIGKACNWYLVEHGTDPNLLEEVQEWMCARSA